MPPISSSTTLSASALALLLSACTTVPPQPEPRPAAPPSAAGPAAPAAGSGAPAAAPAPAAAAPRPAAQLGALPPFADVTREAKRADGFLPLWTRDDKTWIEIPTAMLDQPMFLGLSVAGGIGIGPFWPGMMGRERIVVLRRVGNTVQLLARNHHARAPAGTPLARAVNESYSDSLLGTAPLAAAPQPGRGALLVEAAVLLGGDIPGAQTTLEQRFRLPYALDRANSSVERARTQAEGLFVTMRSHFAVPKLPVPPVAAPGAPPPNPAALPSPPPRACPMRAASSSPPPTRWRRCRRCR